MNDRLNFKWCYFKRLIWMGSLLGCVFLPGRLKRKQIYIHVLWWDTLGNVYTIWRYLLLKVFVTHMCIPCIYHVYTCIYHVYAMYIRVYTCIYHVYTCIYVYLPCIYVYISCICHVYTCIYVYIPCVYVYISCIYYAYTMYIRVYTMYK